MLAPRTQAWTIGDERFCIAGRKTNIEKHIHKHRTFFSNAHRTRQRFVKNELIFILNSDYTKLTPKNQKPNITRERSLAPIMRIVITC